MKSGLAMIGLITIFCLFMSGLDPLIRGGSLDNFLYGVSCILYVAWVALRERYWKEEEKKDGRNTQVSKD